MGFRAMKFISAAPLLLLLSGCNPSPKTQDDLDGCYRTAQRAFPRAEVADATAMSDLQKSCMADKGYRFSAIAFRCGGDLYGDAACYTR